MSLLTAKFVEKSHIWVRIYFIFLKNVVEKPWNSFNAKFQLSARKSSYQVRQNLAFFFYLIALILGDKRAKSLRVTKIVKEINFEGVLGELESKKCFQRQ